MIFIDFQYILTNNNRVLKIKHAYNKERSNDMLVIQIKLYSHVELMITLQLRTNGNPIGEHPYNIKHRHTHTHY